MRITVSGSHCSGKSTLIDRFLASHPEYIHERFSAEGDARYFYRQLEISAERLSSYDSGAHVIAERNPLDFLAYLLALSDLQRGGDPASFLKPAVEVTKSALNYVDLLVVLPLNDGAEEDRELRVRMNERLLTLLDDEEFASAGRAVVELTGPPSAELRGVSFCDLPDQFSHAEFALRSEAGELTISVVAEPQLEIGMREFSIHASEMFVRTGTVYYYDRENLRPGERLAAWVNKK